MRRPDSPARAALAALALFASLGVACSTDSSPVAPSGPPFSSAAPSPPPVTNKPPVIDAVSVTTFVVSGLSPVQMSASASDPDGDTVTYRWTFPDGSSFIGPDYARLMVGDGNATISLIVEDARGASASATKTVAIGTMTGRWNYIPTLRGACGFYGFPGAPVLTLTQTGRNVTGMLTSPTPWCNVPAGQTGRLDPAAPGTIDESGAFKARMKIGDYLDSFWSGQMDNTGRQLTGTTTWQSISGFSTFTMNKL